MNEAWLPALEALADERRAPLTRAELAGTLDELLEADLVEVDYAGVHLRAQARADVHDALLAHTRGRAIEWVGRQTTQGEVLDRFANHCRDELDDVEVLAAEPTCLELQWRSERATVQLRAGLVHGDRTVGETSSLALCPLSEEVVTRFLDDQRMTARMAVYDLVRLEKINAVRSSVFVYFEWFLRDAFGVKLLPAPAFTRALVQRGVLSLGMG